MKIFKNEVKPEEKPEAPDSTNPPAKP
jgi:hypothetical protein